MTYNTTLLLDEIELARNMVIDSVSNLTELQCAFKPTDDQWSIGQIVEHLVWAEEGGICGMFKAAEGLKNQRPIWEGESPNHGLSIEVIVQNTWQAKEEVPEVAVPRWGGPIEYWVTRLEQCKNLLIALKDYIADVDLQAAIYPHPISGPMNVVQRLEFLRFHMERHLGQIEKIKAHKKFKSL